MTRPAYTGTPRKVRGRYGRARAVLTIWPNEDTLHLQPCKDCGCYVHPLYRANHDRLHAVVNKLLNDS